MHDILVDSYLAWASTNRDSRRMIVDEVLRGVRARHLWPKQRDLARWEEDSTLSGRRHMWAWKDLHTRRCTHRYLVGLVG